MNFTVAGTIDEIRTACSGITRVRALGLLQEVADEIADELRLGNTLRSIGLVNGQSSYDFDNTFSKIYRVALVYNTEAEIVLLQKSLRTIELDMKSDFYRTPGTPSICYIRMSAGQDPQLGILRVPATSSLVVSNATNASPIVITTSAAHGLTDGNQVRIEGVEGNTNANGIGFVDVLSPTTFALYSNSTLLTAKAGNGAYTASTGHVGTATLPFLWVSAQSTVALADSGASFLPRSALSRETYVHGVARKWAGKSKRELYNFHTNAYRYGLARFKQTQGNILADVVPQTRPYLRRTNRAR
jgi:hypothetical protein